MKTANGSFHPHRVALYVLWLWSVVAVVRAHGSKESLAGGAKYDNHLNASQAFLEPDMISVSRYDSSADGVHSDVADSPFGNHQHHHHHHHQFSCQACQYRNVYAMASLKSIKAHFLMKLGIEYTPNRTRYPEVPERILNSFHDKLAHRQSPVSQLKDSFDYQGDEPSSMQADEPEEAEDDYDYYQITNKIFILPNRTLNHTATTRITRHRTLLPKRFNYFYGAFSKEHFF
ncbi:uncharacterized protein LOC128272358 [Anopheles cruzii]|uniref:uncharacterized protein LOC128272358 n=1 Tax=Anopheles cruzii TaxID=68878 RepID=UPI0022EC76A8|nr:uncharacterized protein LOC128272358 [Anopheles cruzii]